MAIEARHDLAKQRSTSAGVIFVLPVIFVCFCVMMLGAATCSAQAAKWADQLPDGPGKDIVAQNCQLCHTLERVVTSHRPKSEWQNLVPLMVSRGCPIGDDDVATVVDYLTASFGPGHATSAAAPPTGSSPMSQPAAGASKNFIVDPDQAQFAAVPDSLGLPKSVQMIVITGDPSQPGPFSVRPHRTKVLWRCAEHLNLAKEIILTPGSCRP